ALIKQFSPQQYTIRPLSAFQPTAYTGVPFCERTLRSIPFLDHIFTAPS
uniref:Uncharacterized protein n=1 Tax=Parascaris univalens TaxID=6257 RepID=A0A914ZQ84_PARUN